MSTESPRPERAIGYNAERLAQIGAPADAAHALAEHGLPEDAYGWFERVPARELEVTELPECGRAAFLGQAIDGFHNTYWLSLSDGAIWMRYGQADEPVHHMKRINTSVHALHAMLEVFGSYAVADKSHDDEPALEQLVLSTIVRAVSVDPEVFQDDEGWWPLTFQEVEFELPRILLGNSSLTELVRQDESGQWVLDHPGYEDEDEDE
jgi:hypothetical protein